MQTRGDKWLESERGGEHTERVDADETRHLPAEPRNLNMYATKTLCLISILLLAPDFAAASPASEREAILAVMAQVFAAVASKKPEDWRALQLAEGTTLSFRPDPNGEPGELEMRMSRNEEMLAGLEDASHEYLERWTGKPTVLTRGPIAVVWGEYEFWIDGAFSHCGVDAVDLVKIDGEWKVANFMWTVEKENCPTGPKP